MTDQPSSYSEPSMEDILASIRRIIDDEDVKVVDQPEASKVQATPESSHDSWPPAQPQVSPYAVDTAVQEEAAAEYDSAIASSASALNEPDPEQETIFPERGGALWRRVAGHPLSDGETDPLPADDTYELTEAADGDDLEELELNELLDTSDSDPEEAERVLTDVAGSLDEQPSDAPDASDSSAIGIGAMTAAGVGATAAFSSGAMDRIAKRMSDRSSVEEDEVLDLTRRVDGESSVDDLAAAMSGDTGVENAEDLPPPIFERVSVSDSDDSSDDELLMDQSFETVSVAGLSDDYTDSLSGSNPVDAHERELDDRFYNADGFDEDVPDIDGSYATSLGGEAATRMEEKPETGAPRPDELDTVGGLVRDALRSRLPAAPRGSDSTALVSGGASESAARSLAALARYDSNAPRRIYGGIKITDDDDSPTIEGVVQDTLRPMLREWLNDNLPTLVENMVKQEVERISARSRQFVRDDD